MKKTKFTSQNRRIVILIFCLVFCVSAISAQSTRVESPTPITSNEISGKINARDIGDSRLTTYYYVFSGNQGDILLKTRFANFNGDVDVFYAENMRPLTKITIYADSPTEAGREIYLRKPEKLILRVEGRSPNDDAATFSIKFEGSFQALAAGDAADETDTPRLKNEVTGAVRVNSVGTIIAPEPRTESEQIVATSVKEPIRRGVTSKSVPTAGEKADDESSKDENLNRKRVADSDDSAEKTIPESTVKKTATARNRTTARRTARTTTAKTTKPSAERKTPPAPVKSVAEMKTEELAAALENVRLVVLMKDGGKIDRPMSDILRFSVDKGTLTIISKRGAISRYSILEVAKVSIE